MYILCMFFNMAKYYILVPVLTKMITILTWYLMQMHMYAPTTFMAQTSQLFCVLLPQILQLTCIFDGCSAVIAKKIS